MNRVFTILLLLVALMNATSVRADSASLFAQAKASDAANYAAAVSKGASFTYTSDNRSFYGWWQPSGWTPAAGVIVILHGTGGYATTGVSLWQPYAEAGGHAVMALSWWFGSGDSTSDYYTPSEVYLLLSGALKGKGVGSGQAMLTAFSRGSANSYAVAAMDYATSGRRYFGLVHSNAGGAQLGYPPNQEITSGSYGTMPFSGIKWAMYCGEKDPNPDRDGCNAMTAAKNWVTSYGATMVLFTADPNGDHGGFMTNSSNVNQVLDHYKVILSAQRSSDCVFDWVERDFPQYFAPAKAASAIFQNYYFRYYSSTGIYLATSNNVLYALGPVTGNTLQNLGPLSTFQQSAGCPN